MSKKLNSLKKSAPLIIIFIVGFLFGSLKFPTANPVPETETSSSTRTSSTATLKTESGQNLDADFSLFWDAVQVIKSKHINAKDVSDKQFLYGAIRGAVGALDDPYSVFFEPSDAKKFDEDVKGVFGGIGAQIDLKDGKMTVILPLKDNPAIKAGLKAGDIILKIDDTSTDNMDVDGAVKLIRGEPGTFIRLLISRPDFKEPKEFKIERAVVNVPTLDWKMISVEEGESSDILYVQLYNFNSTASGLFRDAATKALLNGTRGVIFDLRDNTGGFLDVAIDLTGWFIDRGAIVTIERTKSGKNEILRAHGNSVFEKTPVVILVNENSASASEILAGALRDQLGVKLVGVKTFGKGSVQEIEYLKDGSSMKISTAEWLTPKGHSIHKKGLEPDVKIQNKEDGKEDLELKKAIETLKPLLPKEKPIPTILISL